MHIIKLKKPNWKGYILDDSNYIMFYNRQNYDGDKINCGWELEKREKQKGRILRIFKAVKLFCMIYCNSGYMSLYICQNHRIYKIKNDPKFTLEIWGN